MEVQETLRKVFGFSDFRPGQLEVIQGVREKKDLLVTMPTGSGKSLIYQMLAWLCPQNILLVISPLTSLVVDQVPLLCCKKIHFL